MQYTIAINTAENTYVNPDEVIPASAFGAEFLGWEPFSNFTARNEELELPHIRWPGGIPVEDGINVDGSADGSREHVFDLKFENLIEWDRNNGDPREGIKEMFAYANETGATFAMVTPTARYVEKMFDDGDEAGLAEARADARIFAEKLVAGKYGAVPEGFTIEVGSEYYATDIWKEMTSDANGRPYQTDPGPLAEKFGKVFAAVVDEMGAVFDDPTLNSDGIEVKLAVQLARHQADPGQNGGDFSDNVDFIEAFIDTGAIDKVDTLLFHKYTPTFDNISRGMDADANGYRLDDAFSLWEQASGGKEFEFLGGYLSPSAGAEDRLEYGAPGLTNLLQVNAQFLAAGMDVGTVYAIGHSNGGSLGWRDELLVGGKLFDLMGESIPGKFLYNGFQDNISNVADLGRSYIGGDHVNSYVYGNDTEVTVFLAASDFSGEQLDYSLQFDESFLNAEVTHLWATGEQLYHPGDGDLIGSFGETSSYTVDLTASYTPSSLDVTFEHDYEVVRIVLEKAELETLEPVATDALLELAPFETLLALAEVAASATPEDDLLIGTEAADQINGTLGNDTVWGALGDDTVKGGWGDDIVDGGAGDDKVTGDWGNDQLFGGNGNDRLFGGDGDNVLFGGAGDDRLFATGRLDILDGGAGDDRLHAGAETTILRFTVEQAIGTPVEVDTVYDFVLGQDVIEIDGLDFSERGDGFSGEDFMRENASIQGNDLEIALSDRHSVVLKGLVSQLPETSTVADFHQIFGASTTTSPDIIEEAAQAPLDWIKGNDADDVLTGSAGVDWLNGGLGDDSISGGSGDDKLKGGWGNDRVDGGAGDDRVTGDWGDDLLSGGSGNDTIFGGEGSNALFGGDGNDRLVASGQRDFLAGGAGNDVLEAGAETTILSFSVNEEPLDPVETDIVQGFTLGEDFLEIEGLEVSDENGQRFWEEFMLQNASIRGDNLEIKLSEGHTVILENVAPQLPGDPSVADFHQVFGIGMSSQSSEPESTPWSDPLTQEAAETGESLLDLFGLEMNAGTLEAAAQEQMDKEAEDATANDPWTFFFA
ncbi:Ca2+-binding RTX toxin-like protein [Roseovarius halotolerans]|uniref:RTX-I toxin determinant A from serotypes 1/9 n=1 Tax=Roseovarius halotolerans TaxID=505353 RepID=A0A1X6YZ14_9RHOB|nr:calcium-binding protein [Roseovarius halotolerans]RKT32538.1 Ca2+-binding RTX toxin-like protein [Roseovarius halotolerans]SLN35943.1 RTX-I toxin determinant A from serotypes 1/9 [Roseovarius halotolerans]